MFRCTNLVLGVHYFNSAGTRILNHSLTSLHIEEYDALNFLGEMKYTFLVLLGLSGVQDTAKILQVGSSANTHWNFSLIFLFHMFTGLEYLHLETKIYYWVYASHSCSTSNKCMLYLRPIWTHDKEIYGNMSLLEEQNLKIKGDRSQALKMSKWKWYKIPHVEVKFKTWLLHGWVPAILLWTFSHQEVLRRHFWNLFGPDISKHCGDWLRFSIFFIIFLTENT